MRATVMHGAGDVRIEDVPDAKLSEPTDALVRVTRAAICGSDLWGYRSMEPSETGRRMGHEFIGVVEAIGDDAEQAVQLGHMFYFGRRAPRNFNQAVYWYQRAANQGHAVAQNNLGACYFYGRGVPRDRQIAIEWFRRAASQGNSRARINLTRCNHFHAADDRKTRSPMCETAVEYVVAGPAAPR